MAVQDIFKQFNILVEKDSAVKEEADSDDNQEPAIITPVCIDMCSMYSDYPNKQIKLIKMDAQNH